MRFAQAVLPIRQEGRVDIPVVELSGTPRERGEQHGRALRGEIEQCLEIYRAAIGREPAELRDRALALEEQAHDLVPDIASEIEGIAAGAGIETWWVHVLNARSELMSVADGCTAVFQPKARLLGQTWDWIARLEKLFVVLRIERPDGHRLLTVSEPGMVGKIGISSAGLGCTLNFISSPGEHRGAPVHWILRSVLEASDLASTRDFVDRSPPGQSGNVMVGSACGHGFDVEFAGVERTIRELGVEPFAHTNHHLWRDIDPGELGPDSEARLSRAGERIAKEDLGDAAALGALLSDTEHDTYPICAPYERKYGARLGTLCTVVMELERRVLRVRRGPHPEAPFHELAV